MYLLGYDIGSSTIKAALIDAQTKVVLGLSIYPENELDIISRQQGWAEQQPEVWWQGVCIATQRLLDNCGVNPENIKGIGIAYQMHGLVLINEERQVLRPAIIWCDSRSVGIGQRAFESMGEDFCHNNLLNSPGNFTASKLQWVKDNEPEIFEKIHKVLLPGDYIAMKFTDEICTTISGLSEGIWWDFKKKKLADEVTSYFGVSSDILADAKPTFSFQGQVSKRAAMQTGLKEGAPITYRAGDQPNNAFALNVLHPGEVAATSGTSGVVYGIVDRPVFDEKSRVNAFAHVNYKNNFERIGILLCLNGAGIQYSWIKNQVARGSHSYQDMERMVSSVPIGSDGLCILPFGNGAERMLDNRNPNAHIFNLQFNRHNRAHLYRAALEGVAFSFVYGINILKEMGLNVDVIRVANDNMFQSSTFSTTLATLLGSQIEVVETTGAVGAAKAAGVAAGVYSTLEEALSDVRPTIVYEPNYNRGQCEQAYAYWQSCLQKALSKQKKESSSSEILKKEKGQLKKLLKSKSRELAASSYRLVAHSDLLQSIKTDLEKAMNDTDIDDLKQHLRRINEKIGNELKGADSWMGFEEHFDLLNDDFLKKLLEAHPSLTIPERKICVYLKMGLSSKEIAQKLNLSTRGVETRRYRLGKKMKIRKGENLVKFLNQL